jgi:hypothetical protein
MWRKLAVCCIKKRNSHLKYIYKIEIFEKYYLWIKMQPVITQRVCQNISAMFHFCLIPQCCYFPRYFFAILHDLCFINSLLLCTPHLRFHYMIILLKFFIQNLVSVLGRQTTVDVYKHTFPLVLPVTVAENG